MSGAAFNAFAKSRYVSSKDTSLFSYKLINPSNKENISLGGIYKAVGALIYLLVSVFINFIDELKLYLSILLFIFNEIWDSLALLLTRRPKESGLK